MKRLVSVAAIALVLAAGAAVAQQAPIQPGMGGSGHQMPMQGGMCPMMGGMMAGGGMMSMMGAPSDSPQMMQMRGEMLKAMGEVLINHGKAMEGAAR
jgi:hypothetical protein